MLRVSQRFQGAAYHRVPPECLDGRFPQRVVARLFCRRPLICGALMQACSGGRLLQSADRLSDAGSGRTGEGRVPWLANGSFRVARSEGRQYLDGQQRTLDAVCRQVPKPGSSPVVLREPRISPARPCAASMTALADGRPRGSSPALHLRLGVARSSACSAPTAPASPQRCQCSVALPRPIAEQPVASIAPP